MLRRATVILALAGLSIGAPVLASTSAPRNSAGKEASISFVRGGSIYLVSIDGRRVSLVLHGERNEYWATYYYDPAWSPDGRRLAVTDYTEAIVEGNDEYEVAVFRLPNTKPSRVRGGSREWQPSWAPDGQRLVFAAWNGGPKSDLDIWNSNARSLFAPTLVSGVAYEPSPAWSPDGSRIAFTRGDGNASRMYVIRPDATGMRRVTNSRSEHPSWSPDGRRIVFADGHRIAVVGVDGSGLRYLTSPATHDSDPAWSSDGQWVAFVRRRPGPRIGDIWLMHPSGGAQRLLVRNAYQPAWKPS